MKRSTDFRAGGVFGMTTSLAILVEQCPPEALQMAGAQLHEEVAKIGRGSWDGQAAALIAVVGDFCLQAAAQKIGAAKPVRDSRDMRGKPQVDDRSVGGFTSCEEHDLNGTEDNLTDSEHDSIDDVNGELAAVGGEVMMMADKEREKRYTTQSLVGAGI